MAELPGVDLTPMQIVDNQYDAFLESESLDPAWVAGWHAAIRHASYALHCATGDGVASMPDPGRCSFVNDHFRASRSMRGDGWRCGKEAGHVNGHYLYSGDGDDVLDTMGPWVLMEAPEAIPPTPTGGA